MTPEERKRLELELELLNLEKEKALAQAQQGAIATEPQTRGTIRARPREFPTSSDRMSGRQDTRIIVQAQRVAEDIANATRKARVGPVDKRANAAADAAMAEFGKKLDSPLLMAMGGNAMQIAGRGAAEKVYNKEGVVSQATAVEGELLNSLAAGLPAILNKDFRQELAQAQTDRPGASLGARAVGSLAPLSGMFSAGRFAANAIARGGLTARIPFTSKTITTPNLIPTGGDAASRLTRYGGSLANDLGNTALGTGTYQAMINEPIQSAAEGRELTLGSMGEAGARGFTDPFNLIPLAASGTMRTWNALTSGVAAPSPTAAAMVNQYGVGPRQTAASQGIAQTTQQFGGQVRPQDIRGLTNIENALRFALRDVRGIPNVNARIADGFQRIRQSLPLVDDPTINLARLIEREFAEDAPQIRAIIRNFLGKVGTDSSAGETIVGGAANQMRGAQADVLEQEAMSVFGNQPKQDAKEILERNLELLGEETYAPIVRAATSAPPQAQQRAAAMINRRPETEDLLFNRADRQGLTVPEYIARNPLEALHWVQSGLATQARALRAARTPDTALEGVIENMKTVLRDNVPNYREADVLYASNARALGRLGTTRGPDAGVEGELKYDPGFGEGLLGPGGAAGRAEGRATAANVFEGMDERSRRAAAISVREVILDDLNKARAAGDDERYEIAARFSKLNSEGALQALVDVFGAEGQRIVNRIRQFVDANEFARDIDPITGSNTKNKFTAAQTGAQPFAGPMGQATQSAAGSLGQNAVGDAFLMASGITSAPLMSAIRVVPWLADRLQPGARTQRNIAETLLRRGQIGSQVQPPPRGPGPIEPLDPTSLPGYRPPGAPPPGGNPPTGGGPPAGGAPAPQVQSVRPVNVPSRPAPQPLRDEPIEWNGPIPKEPQGLLAFIRKEGGLRENFGRFGEQGYMAGTVRQILGDVRSRPGLLNNKDGKTIDEMARDARLSGFDVVDDESFIRLLTEELQGRGKAYRIGEAEEWNAYQEFLRDQARNENRPRIYDTIPFEPGAGRGNPVAGNSVHASIMSDLMPSRPPSFVRTPDQAMRNALAGGAAPLPGPGDRRIPPAPPAPAVGPTGNQSAEETFFSTAPTTAPPPIRVKGMSKAGGNKHGLMPHLRMQSSQPPTGKAKLVQDTNAANASRQIAELDGILKAHPNALQSPQGWAKMMSDALGSDDVPVAPYAFIRDMKDGTAQKTVQSLTPGQIADADHGFSNAARMKEVYVSGRAKPSDTGSLFAWGFLSRGVSPYTQESLFIDAFNGLGKWIDDAANGTFDIDAYLKWAKTAAPKGSNQPGAGASHNLNAFGELFLQRMSHIMPGTNISKMEYLHNLMSDPNMTGPQIRREFARIGQGVGIDNKVVSFTLLVSGRDDVMVLDRVQIRKLWNDGRFDGINLYDGHKVDGAVVTGSALSNLTYGARGLLVYEAIERHLAKNLKNIYAGSGREAKASIGRYHWETWVADSQQEASHGTLDAILKRMVGDEDPMAGVVAKQGEYGSYSYGARYGRDAAGAPFIDYPTPSGATYRMTPQDFAAFREQMKKARAGIIPRGKFSVSDAGDQPWYNKEGVNKSALDDLAAQYGRRTDNGSVSGIDGGTGEGQDFANGRQNDLSGAAGKQQKGTGQSPATKERRTVGKPKKPSKIGTRTADAAAITTLAVGGPAAEADTEDENKTKLAELAQQQANEQSKVDQYEQALKAFEAMPPTEKQAFLKNNGYTGKNGETINPDGDVRGITGFAIETYRNKIGADIATAKAERDKAKKEANRLEVAMAMKPQKETNPLIDKAQEMATYGAMIYGAHRLRKMGLDYRQGEADKVAAKANALLTRLPVPPETPRRTLYSRVPIAGSKEKARIKRETTAANKAQFATEERLAGRNIPPISPNITSPDGLPNRLANVDEFDRQAAAGDFGPVSGIGRFMEPVNSRFTGGDLSLIGGGMADAYIMQGMLDKTREEIKTEEKKIADEQLKPEADQSAAVIDNSSRRLEQLRTTEQVQVVLQRVGIGLAIGSTVALGHGRYARPQPRYEAAARERDLVNRAMAPAPPPTPSPPPTSTKRTTTTSRTVGKPKPKPPVRISFSSGRPPKASNDNN